VTLILHFNTETASRRYAQMKLTFLISSQ